MVDIPKEPPIPSGPNTFLREQLQWFREMRQAVEDLDTVVDALEVSATPAAHASTHISGGTDALSGTLAVSVSGNAATVTNGVYTSRTISAGTGLSGGGDLSADRSFAVSFGTTTGTVCQGDDSRLSDARTPVSHAHAETDITDGALLARLGDASTVFAGTLRSTGNFDVNTDKFTVNASTGNTVVAGTLGVTGGVSFGSTLTGTNATQNVISATKKLILRTTVATGNAIIDIEPVASDGAGLASFRFFRTTNTTGDKALYLYEGFNTGTAVASFVFSGASAGNVTSTFYNKGTGQFTSDLTVGGDLAVNGGDVTSTSLTVNLFEGTTTTLNIGGNAAVNIGKAATTTAVRGDLSVVGNTTMATAKYVGMASDKGRILFTDAATDTVAVWDAIFWVTEAGGGAISFDPATETISPASGTLNISGNVNATGGIYQMQTNNTNNTVKNAYWTGAQYASTAEPEGVCYMWSANASGWNKLQFGGNTNYNGITSFTWYTTADTTTRGGTLQFEVNHSGVSVENDLLVKDALQVDGNTTLGNASTDTITCNARWLPRQVNDNGMLATNGTEGEIVYNQYDNLHYGCTATGDPATWYALMGLM